jgi:hypothetical protein
MARMRTIFVRLVLVVLVTAASLVVAEYVARFTFRDVRSSGNSKDFIGRRGSGIAIVNNSLGFREREIPPKAPGRYRIAVVGDSFTWGQGLVPEQRFSHLIEAALGPAYEVFNFGEPGNNMPDHLDVLAKALPIRPDFVLLQLYINDFEMPEMVRPRPQPLLPPAWDAELERSSLLYNLASRRWADLQPALGVSESYPHYMARNLRDPTAPNARRAYGLLREFIERARTDGVPSGTVMFPAPDAMGAHGSNYPFGYLHEGVAATCAAEQIRCLDLLPPFSTIADPHSMWVSPFDAHPNAMANQRAAEEILQQFGPLWRR